MKTYSAIGLMSGSSLDGLDLAYCLFSQKDDQWHYEIKVAETIAYAPEWKDLLLKLPDQRAKNLVEADLNYGRYLGEACHAFCGKHGLNPDLIASHGHTIFHEPAKGYTYQLGNGQALASTTNKLTISDFRIKDIQLGGQGAPLVPIGDRLLFSEYDFCLNLGGIANISFDDQGKRVALDICAANQLLNYLSHQLGKAYDANGSIAQLGMLDNNLFEALNRDPYFKATFPKSMSNQKVMQSFIKQIDGFDIPIANKLYTAVKHIAFQINQITSIKPKANMLVTGGGAHNTFLLKAIQYETGIDCIVPHAQLVDFKEAMVFAFMGVLRHIGAINCLASATAAKQDSCGGNIFHP